MWPSALFLCSLLDAFSISNPEGISSSLSNGVTLFGTVWLVGVGIPTGIDPLSTHTPSPNQYGRCVVAVLLRVGITSSELSTPPVGLIAFPGGTPVRPECFPPRFLLCGRYPPPNTGGRPFPGCRPRSGCDLVGVGGLWAHTLAPRTLKTSTGIWVRW